VTVAVLANVSMLRSGNLYVCIACNILLRTERDEQLLPENIKLLFIFSTRIKTYNFG